MPIDLPIPTPLSLLEQLRQKDNKAAWDRFAELYTPMLYAFGRKLGLSKDEGKELVQETFIVLLGELPGVEYDPNRRFRGWLWTVFRRKCGELKRPSCSNMLTGRKRVACRPNASTIQHVFRWNSLKLPRIVGRFRL